ncbi:MAG TPA: phytanoyl-CoA dioxygenase family protein [Planctomycetota bacterium]|nr:phytanoyl-CoA dioxygenase family protein [Planctomycetota bacterium]
MLTQSQIDAFHRDGFLVMPGLITGRELKALQDAAARCVAEGIARGGADHLYHDDPTGTSVYCRSERMWERDPAFRAVTVNPALVENIGQCIGHDFFPWNDSLVVKNPGGAGIAWHQDPPYGDPARRETYVVPNFTTDIYLDESDEDNGCVWAIPGHHLVGNVALAGRDQDELFAHPLAVPVRMKPGDVLFHALSTPHGSRPNPAGQRMRRTFYIHYISQEAHDQCGYHWGKLSWGDAKRAQLARMAADRAALGFGPALGPNIRENEEGLRFTGAVTTPLRHWRSQLARIPQARRDEMKALKALAAARG